jgi:uncharacterized protein YPO0396
MFKETVKKSFSNVKKDIMSLNSKIFAIEAKLDLILAKLEETQITNKTKNAEFNEYKVLDRQIKEKRQEISIGNEGDHSFIHSPFIHSFTDHAPNIQDLKKNLENKFNQLTSQEFLVFLTIYQLEEELKKAVTYADLSIKLKLSTGCIRSYISSIIRKELPLIKQKLNNKIVTLTIHPDFKELNLKERLTNIYYYKDQEQTRLF